MNATPKPNPKGTMLSGFNGNSYLLLVLLALLLAAACCCWLLLLVAHLCGLVRRDFQWACAQWLAAMMLCCYASFTALACG